MVFSEANEEKEYTLHLNEENKQKKPTDLTFTHLAYFLLIKKIQVCFYKWVIL